jgi:hypothetical protein
LRYQTLCITALVLLTVSPFQAKNRLAADFLSPENAPTQARASRRKETPVQILAKASWRFTGHDPAVQRVVRSAADLAKVPPMKQEDVVRALKIDNIDWGKQMLLMVSAGLKPTGGYRVEITAVSHAKDALIVHWKLHVPEGMVTEALEHPAEIALVERFNGLVCFEQDKK